jgi:hypothetical protein
VTGDRVDPQDPAAEPDADKPVGLDEPVESDEDDEPGVTAAAAPDDAVEPVDADPDAPARRADWIEQLFVEEKSRWRRVPPLAWAALGVLALILCAVAWTGFKAWQLDRSISRAEVDVSYLRLDLAAGRFVAFVPDTDRLQSDATAASSASHDPIWVMAGHVPFVGRNLRAASVVAQSLSRVVNGALVPISRSHTFTVAASDNAGVSNLLTALGEDGGTIAAAVTTVQQATADVDALHTGGLVGRLPRCKTFRRCRPLRQRCSVRTSRARSC